MKMLITTLIFTTLTVPMAFAAQSSEQTQARYAQKLMQRFDSNQDGQITLDEVQAQRDMLFSQVDINSDSRLSLEEFAQLSQIRKKTRFNKIDTNDDASISLEEIITDRQNRLDEPLKKSLSQRLEQRFEGADTNGDYVLNFEEFTNFSKPSKTLHTQNRMAARFTQLDNDQNGLISRFEFISNVRLFDRFDCNEDGFLSQEELQKKPCLK